MSRPEIYHGGGDYVLLRFSKIWFIPFPAQMSLNPCILQGFKGGGTRLLTL